jgi:hypothetical protein
MHKVRSIRWEVKNIHDILLREPQRVQHLECICFYVKIYLKNLFCSSSPFVTSCVHSNEHFISVKSGKR